jgi:tRNA threonylcarbamoyl adenosine modification protein YeaZ
MTDRLVLVMDGSTHVTTTALLAAADAPGRAGSGCGADDGWQVLAQRTDVDSRGQARVVLRLVDDMLHEIGAVPAGIAAIVAGVGPGTFTGVRIAVATARALALALAVPVTGVSTLSALAAEAASRADQGAPEERPDLIVPVVDARRGQAFYGVYRASGIAGAGTVIPAERPFYARSEPFAVCDREALGVRVAALAGEATGESRALIVGEVGGIPRAGPELGEGLAVLALEVSARRLLVGQGRLRGPGELEGSYFAPWIEGVLSRRSAGARDTWRAGEPGSPESVKPIYVRSPDADIHITKMRDPWAGAAPGR